MKNFIILKLKENKGQGLVEALIGLAIIGVVMIGITLVTIRSLKVAKKNEVQDVATQAMVEAMDYLKAPGDITAFIAMTTTAPKNYARTNATFLNQGGFFRLDDDASNGYRLIAASSNTFINTCDPTSTYVMRSLQDPDPKKNYNICIQVYIAPRGTAVSEQGYDIYLVGVWQAPDGTKINKIKGFRSKEIIVSNSASYPYNTPTYCNVNSGSIAPGSCAYLWINIPTRL